MTWKPAEVPSKEALTIPLVLSPNASFETPANAGEGSVPQSLSLIAFKDVMEFSYLLDNFVWRTFA